jgi:hypothetical protein
LKISELNEDKVGEVLTYLANTDERYASAKAQLESTEILRKRVRAKAFLANEDGSVAERNAEAETAEETQAADDAYIKALAEFESLKATRQRGELIIEVWRSLEASRRKTV